MRINTQSNGPFSIESFDIVITDPGLLAAGAIDKQSFVFPGLENTDKILGFNHSNDTIMNPRLMTHIAIGGSPLAIEITIFNPATIGITPGNIAFTVFIVKNIKDHLNNF